MKDRYEIVCFIDDAFKECKSIADMNFLFIQMQNDVKCLFEQNLSLRVLEEKEKGCVHE